MKKILSVLICLAMLLSGFALAAGSELTISNLAVSVSDGTNLDFSGIDLKLAAAESDTGAGLRIALDANGETVLSGVAALNEQGIVLSLDGMNNAYTVSMEDIMLMLAEDPDFQQMMQLIAALDFTEEDLAELIAIFETFSAQIEAGIVETGTEELDGVTYQSYTMSYDEELADALYRGIFGLLDKHPALVSILLEGSDFTSMMEVYEAMGLKIRFEGEALANESESEISLSAYGTANDLEEEIQMNNYIYTTVGIDEEAGVQMEDMTMALSQIENEEYIGIVEVNGCVTTQIETGELAAFEGYLIVPTDEENWDGLSFGLYSPMMTGTDLWQISFGDWNETFTLDISFGQSEGVDGVYGLMLAEDAQLSFYSEMQDGVGEIGFAVADAEFGVELLADVAVTETDGAWLDVDTANAVDILTITDEQVETFSMEAMIALMGAVSELAAANDTLAVLIGNLMG